MKAILGSLGHRKQRPTQADQLNKNDNDAVAWIGDLDSAAVCVTGGICAEIATTEIPVVMFRSLEPMKNDKKLQD
jgi:hypothetical protein